jgi:predicted nucleotidyltransferase
MIHEHDIERIVKRIVAFYDPEFIYLFGSYAKGTMTPDSDLDFVIVKGSQLPPYLRGKNISAALAEVPVNIDCMFVTPEELERECSATYSLLALVMPTALLLYKR